MKDPRVEMLKVGMTQHGRGMPIQVFRGTSRYQYGGGVGEALRSIWRFVYPIIVRGAASFIKHGGEAFSQHGSIREALKAGIKPALGSMIKTAGEEIAHRVEASSVTAPPPEPPIRHQDASEVGTAPPNKQSGAGHALTTRRRRRALSFGLYKGNAKRCRMMPYDIPNFAHYNF